MEQKTAIREQKKVVREQKTIVREQKFVVREQKTTVREQKTWNFDSSNLKSGVFYDILTVANENLQPKY